MKNIYYRADPNGKLYLTKGVLQRHYVVIIKCHSLDFLNLSRIVVANFYIMFIYYFLPKHARAHTHTKPHTTHWQLLN